MLFEYMFFYVFFKFWEDGYLGFERDVDVFIYL